mmetsp:Transcript_27664/g.54479  ORF Transcript_27664/g.54479 Transcript_27664/m.54479 type:complete len:232 (+) Transcript_27664:261-956(+)
MTPPLSPCVELVFFAEHDIVSVRAIQRLAFFARSSRCSGVTPPRNFAAVEVIFVGEHDSVQLAPNVIPHLNKVRAVDVQITRVDITPQGSKKRTAIFSFLKGLEGHVVGHQATDDHFLHFVEIFRQQPRADPFSQKSLFDVNPKLLVDVMDIRFGFVCVGLDPGVHHPHVECDNGDVAHEIRANLPFCIKLRSLRMSNATFEQVDSAHGFFGRRQPIDDSAEKALFFLCPF